MRNLCQWLESSWALDFMLGLFMMIRPSIEQSRCCVVCIIAGEIIYDDNDIGANYKIRRISVQNSQTYEKKLDICYCFGEL